MSDLPPPPPDDADWSSQPPTPPGPAPQSSQTTKGWANLGTGEAVELAGPAARLGGRLIDFAIVVIVSLVLFFVLLGDTDEIGASILWALASAAIGILYEVTMIANLGQTIGKMATKIKVVRADNGLVPGWSKAVIRWILPAAASFIPILGFLAWLLVYCSLLWDKRRQGWHDKAAGTLVVKA